MVPLTALSVCNLCIEVARGARETWGGHRSLLTCEAIGRVKAMPAVDSVALVCDSE